MKAFFFTLISAAIFALSSCESTQSTKSDKVPHHRASDPLFALSSPAASNEAPLVH